MEILAQLVHPQQTRLQFLLSIVIMELRANINFCLKQQKTATEAYEMLENLLWKCSSISKAGLRKV
jgi:hypothetical protein